MHEWLNDELCGSIFKDKRLSDRFIKITKALAGNVGDTIPQACEHWSMAKATYRFLSNDRIEESEILKGHYQRSAARIEANDGPVLVLHDTTEFTYSRKNEKAIGYTRKLPANKRIANAFGHEHKACGVFMHASLAISQEGLPLGLTGVKFWSRSAFKGTNKYKL